MRILIGGISACGSLSSSGSRTRTPSDGSFAIAGKNLSACTAKPFGGMVQRCSGQVVGAIRPKVLWSVPPAGPLTVALCALQDGCSMRRCSQGTLDYCCGRMLMAQHPRTSSTMRSFGSDSRFIIVEITFSNVRARCGATAVGSAEKVARANTACIEMNYSAIASGNGL